MSEQQASTVYLCKYQVKTLVFMFEDEKLEMDPSNVLSIEYLCDYEMNLRSIVKLSLRMDIRKKLWLLKHKRDIICKFELDKIGMNSDVEKYVTSPEEVWNEEFGIYFNNEDEAIDVRVLAQRLQKNDPADSSIDDISTESYFESQNMLDVYLFNQKLLNASTKTYNKVYTKDTMQQFIGRAFTATKHNKVLISRLENDEVYKELLVPALPLYKALIYLDQYYGLYKKGSMIFYDVDVLYVLNANGKVTAKREDEWTESTFLVTRIDGSTPGNGMVRREGEKISYISVPDANVNPQKFSILNNANVGSEAKMVITDDVTIDTEEADQSYIDQRNQTIIYQHKGDNKYSKDMVKARMEEAEVVLFITGDNMDIRAFTPNREFHVVFDEQLKQDKYGKYGYRIGYAYHCIRLEAEGFMSASHQIMLKRRAED